MWPTVNQKHLFVPLARKPFGNDAAGEPGANHEPIKHEHLHSQRPLQAPSPATRSKAAWPFRPLLFGLEPARSVRSFPPRFDPTKSVPVRDRPPGASGATDPKAT